MSKVIFIEKTDTAATLTTWLYCSAWVMWAAEQLGFNDVYINWQQGHNPPRALQAYEDAQMGSVNSNQFEWYFKQPKLENPPPRKQANIWTWEHLNWDSGIDVSPYQFMSQPLEVIRDYYHKHFHFNEETNRRGQILVDKYGVDFEKTIGISWRGTDVYLDGRPRIPIEVYFPFIEEILEANPNFRLMVTAEEEKILDPLFKRYGERAFKIDEFISSPFQCKHNPERLSNVSGYERGLQPALMVWLFSKCAHYIKNRSSTGAVASWISDGRIVSIGHPENLGFPANIPYAEIEGKLYPINI